MRAREKREHLKKRSRFLASQVKCPLRGLIGGLMWLTRVRPDSEASLCQAASDFGGNRKPLEQVVADVNGLVDYLQSTEANELFRRYYRRVEPFSKSGHPLMITFTDASASVPHRVGSVTVLLGGQPKDHPQEGVYERYNISVVDLHSAAPKRVTASSAGTELLGTAVAVGQAAMLKRIYSEIGIIHQNRTVVLTDSRNVLGRSPPTERNLRPDFYQLEELRRFNEVVLAWTPGPANIADVLTKHLDSVQADLMSAMFLGFMMTPIFRDLALVGVV